MPLTKEAQRTFTALKTVEIDTTQICDLEFDYDQKQYPEYEDSYIISATWKNTDKELTDEELEVLNDDSDYVYESLLDHIY